MELVRIYVFLASFAVYRAQDRATFYLTTQTQNISVDINHNEDKIKPTHPIKFIIHGWTQDANQSQYLDMAHAYLSTGDYNVIRVDYSALSDANYYMAMRGIEDIGKHVGEFIARLHGAFGIPVSNIHVIGHSLGGQVSGYAGRTVLSLTGRRIARITALDPARPNFENNRSNDTKLTQEDAETVDILHTDAGVYGYENSMGTIDFYPNGGIRLQPGCNPTLPFLADIVAQMERSWTNKLPADNYCSHSRSVLYFTESILTKVDAVKCDSWDSFKKGACDDNVRILFGSRAPSTAQGNYYLFTKGEKPYLKPSSKNGI